MSVSQLADKSFLSNKANCTGHWDLTNLTDEQLPKCVSIQNNESPVKWNFYRSAYGLDLDFTFILLKVDVAAKKNTYKSFLHKNRIKPGYKNLDYYCIQTFKYRNVDVYKRKWSQKAHWQLSCLVPFESKMYFVSFPRPTFYLYSSTHIFHIYFFKLRVSLFEGFSLIIWTFAVPSIRSSISLEIQKVRQFFFINSQSLPCRFWVS